MTLRSRSLIHRAPVHPNVSHNRRNFRPDDRIIRTELLSGGRRNLFCPNYSVPLRGTRNTSGFPWTERPRMALGSPMAPSSVKMVGVEKSADTPCFHEGSSVLVAIYVKPRGSSTASALRSSGLRRSFKVRLFTVSV